MNAKTCSMLALLAAPLLCHAETIGAPTVTAGDSWNYTNTLETGPNGWRQTHDTITALRTTSDHIYVEVRPTGSTQAPVESIQGANWSRSRNVNGTETLVNEPLSFPLTPGKQWEVKYTEPHPNVQLNSRTFDTKLRVVGHEAVDVPAGHFDAIKIEGEGQWTAEIAPSRAATSTVVTNGAGTTAIAHAGGVHAGTTTGRLYKAFWYVPKVNRWVKSVEEYYDANGTRTQRFSSELDAFHSGAEHGAAPTAAQPAATASGTPAS